jgi:serine/threonine protein kinase
MKPYFTQEATALLTALLQRDPSKRLGSGEKGAGDLRDHAFFKDIDWESIRKQTHEAVFRPKVKGPEDISCIDKLFTKEGLEETYVDPNALSAG